MSDLREAYVQAVYFRRRAWQAVTVIAVIAFVVGFFTGRLM